MNTELPIKLKDGSTLPAGLPVSFTANPRVVLVTTPERDEPLRIRTTSAFRPPELDELAEMAGDGLCLSVAGETVEPDGHDPHGAPSWLLVLDLI